MKGDIPSSGEKELSVKILSLVHSCVKSNSVVLVSSCRITLGLFISFALPTGTVVSLKFIGNNESYLAPKFCHALQ